MFLIILVKLALLAFTPKPGVETVVVACGVYFLWSMIGRMLLGASMRRGLKLMLGGKYREAIAALQDSADFFKRNRWLDELRWIFLLSSAKSGYREMALVNMAYCNMQLHEKTAAFEQLDIAKAEFPESQLVAECADLLARNLENVEDDTTVTTIISPTQED